MRKKTPCGNDPPENTGPGKPLSPKKKEQGSLTEDQLKRGYYYDDAYGYQKYDPNSEEQDEDDAGDDT